MKRTLLGLSVAAAIVFLLWPKSATVPPPPDAPPQKAADTAPTTPEAIPTTAAQAAQIDGYKLTVTGDTLQATPVLIELFNSWLADTQSERYEDWKPKMLQKAANLSPAAREQLGKLLDQYVELNLALQLMSVQGEPTWDNILANVRSARAAYFSEQDMGMFADQIALENFTETVVSAFADDSNPLATLVDLQQDASLLPAYARGKSEAMLNLLSQALQQDQNLANTPQTWQMLVQANAAATLETPSVDLTESNADFLKRYNVYSEAREALLQQGASEDQLKALRETHFRGAELLRAGTFDKALAE